MIMSLWWQAVLFLLLVAALILLTFGFHGVQKKLGDEGVEKCDPGEYHRAHERFIQAQRNFEIADPDFIDTAVYDLMSAESRFGSELRRLKQE